MKPGPQYVAVVGAVVDDFNYSNIVSVLGPYPDHDEAVRAGIAEADRKNKLPVDGPEHAYSILPLTKNEP
jgi:hypothetical protein